MGGRVRGSSQLDLWPPCLGAGGPWKGQPSARRSPPHPPGRVGGGVVWSAYARVSWLQSRPWSPRDGLQPLSLPCSSCSNGDKVNPFPGRPGDRLCSQRNTAWLWAATERDTQGQSKRHEAAELSRPQQPSRHTVPRGPALTSANRGRSTPFPNSWGQGSGTPQSLFFFSRRHPHPHLVPQGKPLQLPDSDHNYASVSGGPALRAWAAPLPALGPLPD